MEDEKTFIEYLLVDFEAKLNKLEVHADAHTAKIKSLESSLLERHEMVETFHL